MCSYSVTVSVNVTSCCGHVSPTSLTMKSGRSGTVTVTVYSLNGCDGCVIFFFFQAEDGIRDLTVTGVQTCALPILADSLAAVPGGRSDRSQRIGGRLFVWRDSVWTDIAHSDSLRVVNVAAYSDAYFALLRALPELEIGRASCRERV